MCLSESIVQAYIDVELATEAKVSALAHIDACSKCKLGVNEAFAEQQIVTSALAHEMELPVPTARLRARIYRAIKATFVQVPIDSLNESQNRKT